MLSHGDLLAGTRLLGLTLSDTEVNGRAAVQVDPIKPQLRSLGTTRLKQQCDILLSTAQLLLSKSTCASTHWAASVFHRWVEAGGHAGRVQTVVGPDR
jgi:hypothetical protein